MVEHTTSNFPRGDRGVPTGYTSILLRPGSPLLILYSGGGNTYPNSGSEPCKLVLEYVRVVFTLPEIILIDVSVYRSSVL